jgi:hypothetical protein
MAAEITKLEIARLAKVYDDNKKAYERICGLITDPADRKMLESWYAAHWILQEIHNKNQKIIDGV